jgi:type III secretory pathway component EscR
MTADAKNQVLDIIEHLPFGPLKLTNTKGTHLYIDCQLAVNDVIVAVNGKSWTQLNSVLDTIKNALDLGMRPVLVTVSRNGKFFSVFLSNPIVSDFKVLVDEEAQTYQNVNPVISIQHIRTLSNYTIVADQKNSADVIEMRRTFGAMVFSPFWLIARRLWEPLIALICTTLTALSVNTLFGVLIYLVMCIYIGRQQVKLSLTSMTRDGLYKKMVIAARNELEAQNVAHNFHEGLKFKFSDQKTVIDVKLDVEII